MGDHVFVGFGFGPIQSGLFLNEAFQSGNFSRLVVAEIDQNLVDAVTLWGLVIALMISIFLNFRHWFLPCRREKHPD